MERNILALVIVSINLGTCVRKWDATCCLNLTFWIHIEVSFRKTLVKTATVRVKAFMEILSKCNRAVRVPGTTV